MHDKRPPRRYYKLTDHGRLVLGGVIQQARREARLAEVFTGPSMPAVLLGITRGPRTPCIGDYPPARRSAPSAGDSATWEELVRRYNRLVRSTVASFRLQGVDAEDAVQNTWLRVVERMDTIRDPERLGGWLATTARRECLVLIRRRHPGDS